MVLIISVRKAQELFWTVVQDKFLKSSLKKMGHLMFRNYSCTVLGPILRAVPVGLIKKGFFFLKNILRIFVLLKSS